MLISIRSIPSWAKKLIQGLGIAMFDEIYPGLNKNIDLRKYFELTI